MRSSSTEKSRPGSRHRRAVLVGGSERPLVELLSDVLEDVDVVVHVDGAGDGEAPDVVLVVVDRNDLAGLFQRARAVAAGAPVLAILPFHDERLVKQLSAYGVSACYSLDSPIEQLKAGLIARSDAS